MSPNISSIQAREVKTRNALFKASRFADLPGWTRDDQLSAWDAFLTSCKVLGQREAWKPVCANASRVERSTPEVRRFFETEFALFRLLNVDASAEGEVTGYYEPLISGSLRAEGEYTVPVYGVPNDLHTMDWKSIPPAQRRSTVHVVAQGRKLVVAAAGQAGSHLLDATQFEIDSRDRRWRVRLEHGRAVPYRTRSEIETMGRLDAPVVAWVDDALALYAMQVQGSGRIRLRDGRILRLQYAEQNGHPFKPVRLVAKASPRLVTRGAAPLTDDEPERFELARDVDDSSLPDATVPIAAIVTRGAKPPYSGKASTRKDATAATADALVEELLGAAQRKRVPEAPRVAEAEAEAGVSAGVGVPTPPASARSKSSSVGAASVPGTPRITALGRDPSYVFFRVAPDQSPGVGPVGALVVPLTAQRSIAVDPRVTPMGYPVYLSAPTPPGSAIALQRLVMAQDTGGAIRGAIRADFFWGFGTAAGNQAMRTRERGQMWLMLPRSEAARLHGSSLVTRGVQSGIAAPDNDTQCLIADETFCSEIN